MKSIGLDIGTTSICGVLVDAASGEVLESVSLDNDAKLDGGQGFERLQDAGRIRDICARILSGFRDQYEDVATLGVTGQMHGILYLDEEGEAISPLYSWQDERGDLPYQDGLSYCEFLSNKTGYPMATGYGLSTHFCLQERGQIPEGAVTFCTIPDYIAMCFSGARRPLLHKSMAASLGLFRVQEGVWDLEAMREARIDTRFLPALAKEKEGLGSAGQPLFVAPALGDNQASFLGSTGPGCDIVMNVGTGSQISIRTTEYLPGAAVEFRPYVADQYLIVGSSLCGGAAYAQLKAFFAQTLKMFGFDVPNNIYDIMDRAAEEARGVVPPLSVDTCFRGKRGDPGRRGGIRNIGTANFTPQCLALGTVQGICQELYETYRAAPDSVKQSALMIGSGNGIRKNRVLRQEAERIFSKELLVPLYSEEASYGAALFSLYAAGVLERLEDLGAMVRLEGRK